ncbi:MAG TPA: glycosyltransferase family 4 protein [Longimicrobium sp.]|nr:glycosyltransferase family 4 protein [Longimicrobium sp.]
MTAGTPRVLQCITRMIVGGAQETVLLAADHLNATGRFRVEIATGPDTGSEGDLKPEVLRRDIPLVVVPELANPMLPHRDLRAVWRLYRLMRERRYDVVHTNSTKAGLVGRLAARMARVPVVVHTVHGWGMHEGQRAFLKRALVACERMAAKATERIVTVTPVDIGAGMERRVGTREQYVTIRSGIELDRFGRPGIDRDAVRAELGIPADAVVVGTVGRLSPQKAPLDLVNAARRVLDEFPDTRFVLVGDGPLRPDVESRIAELGMAHAFTLTGLRRDVPELMSAFDVFVICSLWEGLPRVLPQAMATGLPIAASAVDGNAEAVVHGQNGLLTPPGDVPALAETLLRLVRDPGLRRTLGDNGRRMAPEYGAAKMADDLAALYDELLAGNGRGNGRGAGR